MKKLSINTTIFSPPKAEDAAGRGGLKNLLLLLTFNLLLLTCTFAQTGTIQLQATGQTTSYHPGDDGDLQKGVPLPANRFTDHGDGSATDELTGLMWVTDGNLITSRDPSFDQDRTVGDGDINWKTALDYIQKLNTENYLGYNDWRMPNLVEIRSLADLSRPDTALPQGHPFFNLKSPYWTSTTSEQYRQNVFCYFVHEYYVHPNTTNVAGETEMHSKVPFLNYWKFYLLAVRCSDEQGDVELPLSGQYYNFYPGDDGGLKEGTAWPSPRLLDNDNETVTDRLSGLMWAKDANLMLTRNPEYDTNQWVDGAISWQHALNYVALLNTENYLGHNDWRMPNRNEMTSLIDFGFGHPALPERFPFTNTFGYNFAYYYWTSTTRADAVEQAWMVETVKGMMGGGNKLAYEKTRSLHVWPVRTDNNPLPSASISGTITLDGNPYQRAQIELDGPIKSFIRSNLNGEYEFTNLPDGNYTVTPGHKYVRFDPLSVQVTLNGNTVICDFEATFKRAYGWTNISENLFPIGNAAGGILSDLYFIGDEGWIVNHMNSEIYHTTNSGESWNVQEVLAPCNAVYMLSEEEGYAGGHSGVLHKTIDGGENWELFGFAPSTIDALTFTDNGNVGYASGMDGWITKIIDGGLEPEKVSFPDFVSIAFTPSGDYGWTVACFGRKAIYDNGEWTYYGGAMYFPCLNDVQFANESLMFLAQDEGIDRKMGDVYQKVYDEDSASFQGLFTLNEDTVWAVNMLGDIIFTTSGSEDTVHWSLDNIGSEWLMDIFAVDGNHAYAVGGNGALFRYGLLEGFPAGGADILDVVIDQQVSPAIIDNDELKVFVEVEQGTDLTQIIPEIFISPAASIDPPGGTMQDFTFPVTYTVTSENGQTENEWVVTVTITSGIVEVVEAEILIYPNPAKEEFRVTPRKLSGELRVSRATVEIYDLNGRKLLEKQIPAGTESFELDVSSLNSGVYLCRLILENKSVTKKLIIQK